MLVHICCSVDSHYFLQELKKLYPNEKMIGFFYNPNIHPKEEYDLRLFDVKRSCDSLGVDLIVGDYNLESWLDRVKGFEDAEEKGDRCTICFDERFLKSAALAMQLNEKYLTTTLLTSPMKSQNDLFNQGESIAKEYGLEFVSLDIRSNGGTQRQSKMAKDSNLYRQNYCGCVYALNKQRIRSSKIALEMFNNIGRQVLKGSASWTLDTFRELHRCEKNNIPHILQKNSINVYRLLSGYVCEQSSSSTDKNVIPSYIFTHSKSSKNLKSGEVLWSDIDYNGKKIMLGFCDNALFIDICSVNLVFGMNYKNTIDMLYNPPLYDDELAFRIKILGSESVKPFIVLDSMLSFLKINIDSVFQNVDIFEVIKL